ncbi:hypothetical protein [Pseudozobellia thermophila]|uniref:Uncharacterized protein n=1 Tax=Pseudozobellia thermophila TaxID=192903 RepID=A0A1M6C200_9FLAO|nr:hypothetical protein [Pseudozobellia thermophila]SHI54972.1 hypothetical protein SAMN04488513_101611 [Pseudozobellia thermophila]
MNSILLITLIGAFLACSGPTDMEELELESTALSYRISQTEPYLNGVELFKQAAMGEQIKLRKQISELQVAIKRGNRNLLPQLESAQKKDNMIDLYKEDLTMIKMPKVPYPPRPPRGCFQDPNANCGIPKINLDGYSGIQVTEDMGEVSIQILDQKNRVVGKSGHVYRTKGGVSIIPIESGLKGNGVMRIRPNSRFFDKSVYLDIPVYKD